MSVLRPLEIYYTYMYTMPIPAEMSLTTPGNYSEVCPYTIFEYMSALKYLIIENALFKCPHKSSRTINISFQTIPRLITEPSTCDSLL